MTEPSTDSVSESSVAQPTFADLGLIPAVVAALADIGYEAPSPIQAQTIPLLLEGNDLLGQASTGTGKTAAFALPVLSRIDLDQKTPQALVLTPTRELAIQVAEAFQKYAAKLPGFHVLPIYGGQSYTPQLKGLKRGAHVIVGTPGRLIDHVQSGALDLSELKFLVLDEGDEMLQMGFVDDIEALFQQTPEDKQVALFTATLPHAIRRIAQTHMRDPREITVKSRGEAAPKIRQRYWLVSGLHKLDALTRLLEAEKFDAVLVFVRTKIETVELASRLEARGFAASALNGDMEQRSREQTVQRLKDGKIDIVIATDVAARGLDVERISHVINYDIPYDSETYVHRIGRTGRAGRSGDAILFVSPRERNMLRVIERVTQQRIEEMRMPTVADVNQLRLVKFKEKVTEAVLSGAGKDFQPLLEQIESEGNIPAIEIAAALASLMQGTSPLLLTQKDEEPKAPPAIDGSVPTSTYRIAVGHAHGVLPGNIVGAIANEAGIDGKRIGHIDIRDDHSYVDLPTLPDEMVGHLQKTRIRGEEIRISRVDSKPPKTKDGPKFSGKSRRPDRMAEDASFDRSREKPVYRGGGNRFEREGGKRPYKGSPRFADGAQRFEGYASGGDSGERPAAPAGDAGAERPRFERRDRPSFGDKPSGFKKTFKKEGFKPGAGAFKKDGFKKDGFKPAGTGFKKKFTGKAAGAKGSYKGGKAFRDKNR
ncbi:MAG: box helicase [Steroidobacteraceae bacterium]|jgi:ATP-dependent RNA helicase DeaD|nr:box helicase [Steroidobacteraceae bacterium]